MTLKTKKFVTISIATTLLKHYKFTMPLFKSLKYQVVKIKLYRNTLS